MVTLWVLEGTVAPLAPRPVPAFRGAPTPHARARPPPATTPCTRPRPRQRCFRGEQRWPRSSTPPGSHQASAVRPHFHLWRVCPRLTKKKKKRKKTGFSEEARQEGKDAQVWGVGRGGGGERGDGLSISQPRPLASADVYESGCAHGGYVTTTGTRVSLECQTHT